MAGNRPRGRPLAPPAPTSHLCFIAGSTFGFDFLSLANNHILDYYAEGLRETCQVGGSSRRFSLLKDSHALRPVW